MRDKIAFAPQSAVKAAEPVAIYDHLDINVAPNTRRQQQGGGDVR